MIFHITGQNPTTSYREMFLYDNQANTLTVERTGFVYKYFDAIEKPETRTPVVPFSKTTPLKKSRRIHKLKVQLGLSCNYSCDYCSQRFVERPPETTKKDIDQFIRSLSNLDFNEGEGLKIEFWGGEPLVYWKTLNPLVEALDEKFLKWKTKPRYSMITNGSILTEDMVSWLIHHRFSVAVSHDGPGQFVRGPDPFDDPEVKANILTLYRALKPLGRFSFNSMLNQANYGRKEIREWFVNLTGDKDVPLGEGGVIDAYDEGGYENCLATKQQHFEFRKKAFNDIHEANGDSGFGGINQKMNGFVTSLLSHSNADYLGQKCGMDQEDIISIDLKGDVITCQNVSSKEVSKNGEDHLAGNIRNLDDVEITTSTHWKNRPHCSDCPVLHLCQGSCMFLEGKYWDISCANSYSDNVVLFSSVFESITGLIPVFIDAPDLPDHRKDIWGNLLEHQETKVKRVIPISIVSPKAVVEGSSVYSRSKIENSTVSL